MKRLITLYIAGVLIGCVGVSMHKINKINLGMTKQEVIAVMGQPISTSAQGDTEYLRYRLFEPATAWSFIYFVRLIDGKVESYGQVGDFDSTKLPESKSTIDLHIKE